ncbi:MAG: hypothetical protein GKR93_00795 [Gammaproteobacteria bacterium]|nr:hypothetical protein [Gammaproteobacteria bacterium]
MKRLFQRYLLPGFVFQSVVIGGGYSTGRELVEFFMSKGPLTGLSSMLITMIIYSIILGLTFEFARIHQAYDYRTFFRSLIGRGWILFEFSFIAVAMLVLAIIGAASGVIFSEMTNLPEFIGTLLMMLAIGILAFYGTSLIEKMLSFWSFVLYAAYITLFVLAFRGLGGDIQLVIEQNKSLNPDWLSALKYSGINLAAAPAVLFAVRHIQSKRESIAAGILAGPIALLPAIFFYFVLLSQYPEVLEQKVPLLSLLSAIDFSGFTLLFQVVIFGTYIESGVALVHSINERIAGMRRERDKEMPQMQRVIVAFTLLIISIYLASAIGIIDLIGKGYGTLTYFILTIYVLPLITIGMKQILGK